MIKTYRKIKISILDGSTHLNESEQQELDMLIENYYESYKKDFQELQAQNQEVSQNDPQEGKSMTEINQKLTNSSDSQIDSSERSPSRTTFLHKKDLASFTGNKQQASLQ